MGLLTNVLMRRRAGQHQRMVRAQAMMRHASNMAMPKIQNAFGPAMAGEAQHAHFLPQHELPGRQERRVFVNPYDYAQGGRIADATEITARHSEQVIGESLEEVQRALNSRGVLASNRDALHGLAREKHDLRLLFFDALRKGRIRNLGSEREMLNDFYRTLYAFFEENRRNPEFAMQYPKSPAEYAQRAVSIFRQSFSVQEMDALKRSLSHLAQARRT